MPLTKWLGPGVLLLGCVALTFAVARSDQAPSASTERPRDGGGFSVPVEIFEVGESVTVREVRIDRR
jgi:hypothetical protein